MYRLFYLVVKLDVSKAISNFGIGETDMSVIITYRRGYI